jgi:RsiW-degrading membrane proteinase PrsW (M82 family)
LYFYRKDKYEPEPLSWIVKIFLLGAFIVIPIAIGEGIFGIFVSKFVLFVIVAPIIEECGKYFIVKRYVYQTREFNEPVDGIIYAIAAALGFASLENIFYVFSVPLTELATLSTLVFFRAILSVPGHALFSSMWGHSLGIVKFENPRNPSKIIIIGLAGAIVFHALFNYLLMDSLGLAILLLIVIPFSWWLIQRNIRVSLGKSKFK